DTNGIPIPYGKEYLVNMIDETLIRKDIGAAREKGAEIIVVAMHWGQEYSREPSTEQQQWAEKIISWGADLILGSHPHVLQRVEFITTGEGDSQREGIVIYSLGNFIADQILEHTDSGIILRIRYRRNEEGKIGIAEINCVPTWIHRYSIGGPREFRVVAVDDAISDYQDGRDPLIKSYHYDQLMKVHKETSELIWLDPYSSRRELLQTR
ncbi:MAG: CapA family protein, partial [Dethiobacteria bacterium]